MWCVLFACSLVLFVFFFSVCVPYICFFFFFSSRRRHTRCLSDWSSDVCSSDLKQLKPDEVQGGTFTITNPGVFGALFGTPIINQPQVAILGVGNVEKRPVVIEDAIAVRPMAYLTLGYDHRVIDGAVADHFMSHVKRALENWDPKTV